MARPRYHVLVTLPVAWQVRRHLGAVGALAVAAMGVLIDGDHLADWAWMRATGRRDKFLSPLHAWEMLALAGVTAAWLRRGRCRPPAHLRPFPPAFDDRPSALASRS